VFSWSGGLVTDWQPGETGAAAGRDVTADVTAGPAAAPVSGGPRAPQFMAFLSMVTATTPGKMLLSADGNWQVSALVAN
jgi:hypothetical protein